MNQEIIDWYSERHYQPQKVINVGIKHGLTRPQVEAAMVHCYHKIVGELKQIQDIDVARYVFNIAKDVDASKYAKRLELLKDTEAKIQRIEAEADFKVRESKNSMYASWAFIGLINILVWLFYLNWR